MNRFNLAENEKNIYNFLIFSSFVVLCIAIPRKVDNEDKTELARISENKEKMSKEPKTTTTAEEK